MHFRRLEHVEIDAKREIGARSDVVHRHENYVQTIILGETSFPTAIWSERYSSDRRDDAPLRIVRKRARKKIRPQLCAGESCGLLTIAVLGNFLLLTASTNVLTETMNSLRPSLGRNALQRSLKSSRNAVPRPANLLIQRFAATGSSEVLSFSL